ncbi:hypothetical protein BUALT_Bualt02G0235700 [Buddleja alternifolia]|uniref:Photolyase/cryptochrome alpha/beta domain-containing protein n=1 Tax=Buddleja alternifolia TaxID=168488 RepID=A0AAV6YDD2_9LAMI|nr:hypothetical protein BUALT_Bualt02G0235700 [Buddleja alternifolia]
MRLPPRLSTAEADLMVPFQLRGQLMAGIALPLSILLTGLYSCSLRRKTYGLPDQKSSILYPEFSRFYRTGRLPPRCSLGFYLGAFRSGLRLYLSALISQSFLDIGSVSHRRVDCWEFFHSNLYLEESVLFNSANNESISVLPVYCFDPRDYGKSSSGFDKTGPYRATFLIESVADLRKNLQDRGSDLVVRIGRPESVLLEVVKAVGADAVYMHREVSHDEIKAEEKIDEVMKDEGVEVKYFWGSTLYHLEDLPFELDEMPTNYGGFKEKVKGLQVRKTIEALDKMKDLPKRGDVETGEIPSLMDLGLNPNATMGQNGKAAANASLVGGETEALQRLRNFAAECKAKPNNGSKNGTNDSIYGANFSCKISPWLAMGCLSPRSMFDELKKSASSLISAASNKKDGGNGTNDTGMNWLMYELLWRDFFRFITRKYSSKKQQSYAPVTACTGASA